MREKAKPSNLDGFRGPELQVRANVREFDDPILIFPRCCLRLGLQ